MGESIKPRMSALGQEQTFGDTTRNVCSQVQSGRNRRESGHRQSKVRCWGQSGRTGDLVRTAACSARRPDRCSARRSRSSYQYAFRAILHSRQFVLDLQRRQTRSPGQELTKHFRYLPEKAPWLAAFESEVAAFPNGKHDDQVDSLTQFLRALDYRPYPLRLLSLYAGR